jgi:ABC-2 type transport system permease protein
MHKIWAVIRREFTERARTRAFVIGTILGPIMMGALFVLPILMQRNTRVKHIVVLDAAQGGFGARVETALAAARRSEKPDSPKRYNVSRVSAEGRSLDQVRDSLVARTDRRDLGADQVDGIIVVEESALTRDTLSYFGANVGSPAEMGALSRTLRQAVLMEKLTREQISPQVLTSVVKPIELQTQRISRGKLTGESGEASFALAYAMSFVLYMALLIYGMQVMTSTVEEKTNRINEVLVSSMSPFQLLMGKVLGVGSVGLLQLSIWAGTAYVLSSQRERIGRMLGAGSEAVAAMPIPVIPAEVFAVFLLFFVLGFLFYAAAYAAVGSACNTVQETQQVSAPLTILIVVGLMLMFRLLDEPSGTMGRIMSLVPPFAPFVTPVRNSLSPLSAGDLALSVLAMILGVLAMVWVAGRIYRVGVLMYGKRASFAEMFRWIRAS